MLDARTASAIEAFCEQAIAPAAGLTLIDQARLARGLETIEDAAAELPPSRGEALVAEIQDLRLRLEVWFGPDQGTAASGPTESLRSSTVCAIRVCRGSLFSPD